MIWRKRNLVRKLVLLVSILSAAVCLSGTIFAADWPRFLGPSANGFAPDTRISKDWTANPPKVLWSVPLTDGGYAGVSSAAGKVFVIDHKGNQDIVRAIDIKTGKDVWTYPYDDTDKENGGFARATPTFDSGRLYTQSRPGILNCLDAKTGKPIWSRDLVKEFSGRRPGWDYAFSPFVDRDRLIVLPGGEKAGIVALDKKTGKTLWQNGGNVPSYSTPVAAKIMGRPQYVIFDSVGLQGVDVATGAQLWSFPWKTGSDCNAATPIVMGDSIYITTGYGHGCAVVDVTKDGAKLRWQNKEMQAHFSSPIFYKGYVYGNSDPGTLVCIDPKDGTVKWKKEGFGKGALVGVDGVLIALNGSGGDVVMVKLVPDSYQEIGRFKPLEGDCWTAPIVTNGRLVVRDKKKIVCVALK